MRQQESELELEDEVDLVMSSDIVAAQLSTKTISFTREKDGWIWKEDRAQKVGLISLLCWYFLTFYLVENAEPRFVWIRFDMLLLDPDSEPHRK